MKVRCLFLVIVLSVIAFAQMTAVVRGTVTDAQGLAVGGVAVSVRNAVTGFEAAAETDEAGRFQVANIPLQTYSVAVRKDGFHPVVRTMVLRSNVPAALDVILEPEAVTTRMEVTEGSSVQLVDVESTGTRTELNRPAMERMPVGPGSRGLESMLLSMPGFAANANGAIHPRGAHNQMTYVVDGMPISDQLTGAFGNAIDASVVQSIELFTGNVPAEFGNKVSGVAVVTTRTGLGSGRRFSGSTQAIAGGFDTFGNITQAAGGSDKWGYFVSVNALKSNRYLDQVTLENLHNGGNSERVFGRVDYQISPLDQLRVSFMSGRSSLQLANLPSQHAAGQDQRQFFRDWAGSVGWLRTLDSYSTVDTTVSYRSATARLLPSVFDTPVTAEQDRQLATFTAGSRWNRVAGRQTFRIGGDVQRYPVREYFRVGETWPVRRPIREFRGEATGAMYSGFAQDVVRLGDLQVSLGLRYDNYRFLVNGAQFQPRIGVAYKVALTGTVLRASYNRTYQTPPNENLLLSNLGLPGGSVGGGPERIRPERQNVYEVGLQQGVGRYLSVNAAFYHKNSTDLQDNDNFLNTGIIFPITLAQSRTNGLEARLTLVPVRGFSGSLSVTHLRTIVTPPFSGGLFQGTDPAAVFGTSAFVIDHDQPLSAHGLLQYAVSKRFWLSGSVRYDSGLVANPSDPAVVAADPDYRDLLPYVDLVADTPRVRPRTVTDIAAGFDGYRGDRRRWDVVAQLANVGNVTALYNFQSVFVGTRLVQPRTASVKLRWWF